VTDDTDNGLLEFICLANFYGVTMTARRAIHTLSVIFPKRGEIFAEVEEYLLSLHDVKIIEIG